MRWLASVCLVLIASLTSDVASAANFYVSPDGTSRGDGSIGGPWDLPTAFGKKFSKEHIPAGSTVWLRGGTYRGTFQSYITGTAEAPTIIRQYPGERATLDKASVTAPGSILTVRGANAWYWGFEVTNSDPKRATATEGSHPGDLDRGDGVVILATNVKLINLAIHDAADGVGFWNDAVDCEVYGCLTFNNGWYAPDRGHGHGLYIQNTTGRKKVTDVISFHNYVTGMKAFGQTSGASNIDFEGITAFDNGAPIEGLDDSKENRFPNLFIGTTKYPADDLTFKNNCFYQPPDAQTDMGGNLSLGYVNADNKNVVIQGNYVIGGPRAFKFSKPWSNVTMVGNTLFGRVSGLKASDHPDNAFLSARPTDVHTFVRPNRYEPGRATVTVFNWERKEQVAVDLSSCGLKRGDRFAVVDVQNYFGDPLLTAVYDGRPVSLPMYNTVIAPVIGRPSDGPKHTSLEFNTFVVLLQKHASR